MTNRPRACSTKSHGRDRRDADVVRTPVAVPEGEAIPIDCGTRRKSPCTPRVRMRFAPAQAHPTPPARRETRLIMNGARFPFETRSAFAHLADCVREDLPPCTCERLRLPYIGHGEFILPEKYGIAATTHAAPLPCRDPKRNLFSDADSQKTTDWRPLPYRQHGATKRAPRPAA
jgi:hypothetical protein